MSSPDAGRATAGMVLIVVGYCLAGAGMIWGYTGFYDKDMPFLAGLLLGGIMLVIIGTKMRREGNTDAVAWQPTTPPSSQTGSAEPPAHVPEPELSPVPVTSLQAPRDPMPPPLPDPLPPVLGAGGVDDATRMLAHPVALSFAWVVVLPDGAELTIVSPTFVGRDPVVPADVTDARVLAVGDDERSVSKTHAVLTPRGVELLVVDLHSTNGTRVELDQQTASECTPHMECSVPDGASIAFGDYRVRLERRRVGEPHGR